MLKKKVKKYFLCSRYNKDIWGKVTTIHKTSNFWKSKIWGLVLKMFGKWKRLLENLGKNSVMRGANFLNFSFEIVKKIHKKRRKQYKTRMWLFFLTKMLRSYYGNLPWKKFLKFCQTCIKKKSKAFFYFIWMFELRLPMFIYWAGLSSSLEQASQWVSHGLVNVNQLPYTDLWKPIKIYDFITFDISLWAKIIKIYVKVLYYAYKSLKNYKCWSRKKVREWEQQERAHFIATPKYVYFDSWTMSLYWWKEPSINQFRYYFSLNISSIIKYVTI